MKKIGIMIFYFKDKIITQVPRYSNDSYSDCYERAKKSLEKLNMQDELKLLPNSSIKFIENRAG